MAIPTKEKCLIKENDFEIVFYDCTAMLGEGKRSYKHS